MKWPKDNTAARNAFYGDPARKEIAGQLTRVVPPFAMYYEGKRVGYIAFHKKAAKSLEAALKEIWDYYEHDQAKVDAAGVSKYSGAYNHRKIRGSSRWSNHAYGCAIDLNAAENGMGTKGNMPQAVVDAFLRQGAKWGGHYQGRTDPMHFEFVDNGGRAPVTAPPSWPRDKTVIGGTNIVATVFGGSADPNVSAYDEHPITDTELGVALPARFTKRPRVRVTNTANRKWVVCDVVDVGPWNTKDPYWKTGSRPQAESGTDKTGRTTNKAGIDLTPAAARVIGLNGKGVVDWHFVDVTAPAPKVKPTPKPKKPTAPKPKSGWESFMDLIRSILENWR